MTGGGTGEGLQRDLVLPYPIDVHISPASLLTARISLTFPGANLRVPDENGASLTSTLRRAFALKGAEGGVGLGP